MPLEAPAISMGADHVEVCFPAWPARRSLVVPIAARFSERVEAGPLEAAAIVVGAIAVPGVVAVLSVAILSLLLAFVLLAPAAFVIFAWACWRHDRRHAADPAARRGG